MQGRVVWALFSLFLLYGYGQTTSDADTLFQEVLKQANLAPDEVRFDRELFSYYFRTSGTTALFELAIREPLRLPYYAERVRGGVVGSVARPHLAVEQAASWLGISVRRTLIGDPLASLREQSAQPDALTNALMRLFQAAGAPLTPSTQAQIQNLQESLDPLLRQQVAFLVLVSVQARQWRDRAFQEFTPEERDALFLWLNLPHTRQDADWSANTPDAFALPLKAVQKADFAALFAGGHDCALAVQQVMEALQKADDATRLQWRKPFEYNLDTPWGRIRICGGGNDTHPRQPYLLLIDTGGNDTYLGAGANLSLENGVSFLIDLAGDDMYIDTQAMRTTPLPEVADRAQRQGMAFGGAVMGYALHVDFEGDDLYRTACAGLGAARFGVGMLIDLQGNDLYDGYAFTQGAGLGGIGVLIDREGRDQYACFTQGQGFGSLKGAGLLMDITGNDTYVAHEKPVDFPSAQTAERNVSLAQGCGYGRRADYLDGRSYAGGVGILMDIQGNDVYRCSVFGQGSGYWGGFGMLIDLQGDDSREGVWYVQGASAHFAIGYLEDRMGNDRYLASLNMAMGAGHDFGVGYLLDTEGNDEYNAPSLALGGGNANGIGVFVDLAGDDLYQIRSNSANLGRVNAMGRGTLRERAFALGLFLDNGGTDSYPPNLEFAGNGRIWLFWAQQNPRPAESQLGVGMDR
ncbi:MAG: hypothetical protein N2045_03395 [Fimbriimonadales bacterium]|nr:hypothetical protein [Fimbriimonadales bacterium]